METYFTVKLRAAEQGDAKAQFNVGYCYHTGEEVERNFTEAVKWYRKAAGQGDAEAQRWMGHCYSSGELLTKDKTEALKWYGMAAAQGDAESQWWLGNFYREGSGVEKDYAEAYAWFNLASTADKTGASTIAREALEEKMSPQQVGDAQKRTKELRGQIEAALKSRK